MLLDVLADNFFIAFSCGNILASGPEMLTSKVFPLDHIVTGCLSDTFILDVSLLPGRQPILAELISPYVHGRLSYDPHESCSPYAMRAHAKRLPDAASIGRKVSFCDTWESRPEDTYYPMQSNLSYEYCSSKASLNVIFEQFTNREAFVFFRNCQTL